MIQWQSEHRVKGPLGPGLQEVNDFFTAQDFPSEEGEVFYFYYQITGWCNENGMPLGDWKAAASQWLWNLDH